MNPSLTNRSTSYLVEGLQDLQTCDTADGELRKQATNCLSYLFPDYARESNDIRKRRREALATSGINAEGLVDTDPVFKADTKLKLWKMAARMMSMATSKGCKALMSDNYSFDCDNAYRLRGTNDTLNNSAFAAAIPDQKDKYRFWECDGQGRVKEKTIGPEGLSDRLGIVVTHDENKRRAKPCEDAPLSMQLDEVTSYIVNQPDGTFLYEDGDGEVEDLTLECKVDAQQFRELFGFSDPRMSKRSYMKAKRQLRSGEINNEMMRKQTVQFNTIDGMFNMMGYKQIGRILMAHKSQHPTVRKFGEQRPDRDQAVLASCVPTNERGSDGAMQTNYDLAQSNWFFPTDPEAHPMKQFYDYVTVVDGEIVDVQEVTPGWVKHALSQTALRTSAESLENDDEDDNDEEVGRPVERDPDTARGKSSNTSMQGAISGRIGPREVRGVPS